MNPNNVFIITPSEIKNNSRIEISVDDKTLRDLVLITQETKLSEILGDTLYSEIISAIYEYRISATPIGSTFEELLPYCKKYLTYQVISDFIYVNHYKLTNKGTFKLNDANATAATNEEIEWYKTFYDNAVASYKKSLVDYLIAQSLRVTADLPTDTEFSFRGVYMDITDCDTDTTTTGGGSSTTGSGFQGPRGVQGPVGIQGHGITGSQGPEGNQGSNGAFGGPQGEQGFQGNQGQQGIQGQQGFQGYQGQQGIQGDQGPTGSFTTTLVSYGVTGAQGAIGFQGDQGNQGNQGFQGSGVQGAQGNGGVQGNQGNQGIQGTLDIVISGLTGPQGFQGADGGVGSQGVIGVQGNQGSQGVQGQGDVGAQGLQGLQGSDGSQGNIGNQGTQGAQGLQGLQGSDGSQGNIGNQGFQGLGAQGVQGSQGNQGNQGVDGSQGFQGVGAQGAQGAQGNVGSDGNQGLQGVQGAQGSNGNQGLQGAQGNVGSDGNQGLQGAQGNVGSDGNQGLQGVQGAQGSNGNQGLQGVQGAQGSNGNQGFQGNQGNQGVQGNQGNQGFVDVTVQGLTGAQGYQGVQGAQGVQGLQGFQGTGLQGAQGNQGAQGDIGLQGVQGVQGSQGNQGVQGDVGFQGNIGLQGDQGFQGLYGNDGANAGRWIKDCITSGDGDPSSTFFSVNAAFGSATQFTISITDMFGTNYYAWLLNLKTFFDNGNNIKLQVHNVGSTYSMSMYEVTGVTDGTSYFTIGVTYLVGAGDGFCGDVYSISWAAQGIRGFQGVEGFQGFDGLQGFDGPQGAVGDQGFQGFDGPQGFDGTFSANIVSYGTTGAQGPIGSQGFEGVQGVQGVIGNQGFQGSGVQGFQGDQGPTGSFTTTLVSYGVTGAQGFQGTGVQGLQGVQGVIGNQGFQGVGAQGFQGGQGNQGFDGTFSASIIAYGITGAQGYQGYQGAQGLTGLSGDRYHTTSTDTIVIPLVGATVSLLVEPDLSYTENQTVIVTAVNDIIDHFHGFVTSYNALTGNIQIECTETNFAGETYSSWIVNLSGAVGAIGRQGVQGPQGIQGFQGVQGPVYSVNGPSNSMVRIDSIGGLTSSLVYSLDNITPLYINTNINGYSQIHVHNLSSGVSASSDIVATADTGTETMNYIDMGINSSNFTQGYIGGPLDGYLYVLNNNGGELLIGNGGTGSVVIFTGQSVTSSRIEVDYSGNVKLPRLASGVSKPLKVDGTGIISFNDEVGFSYLAASFSTTSTTLVNTGLFFTMSGNDKYMVTINGRFSKVTSATGLRVGLIGAATTLVSAEMLAPANTLTTMVSQQINAINTASGAASVTVAGGTGSFLLNAFVQNGGSTPSRVELGLATVTSNTAILHANTRMNWNSVK